MLVLLKKNILHTCSGTSECLTLYIKISMSCNRLFSRLESLPFFRSSSYVAFLSLYTARNARSQPIITDVNVEGVVSLTRDQIRYLKEMAKNGKISEKALSTIEEYIPGLFKENGQLSVREDHQSESESDLEQ